VAFLPVQHSARSRVTRVFCLLDRSAGSKTDPIERTVIDRALCGRSGTVGSTGECVILDGVHVAGFRPHRSHSHSTLSTQSAVTVTSWLRRPAAAAAPHCRDSSCCCRSRSGGGGACKSTKGQEAAEKDPGASVGGVPTRARARTHTHNRRRSQLTRQRATSSRHRPAIGSEKGENCEVTRRQRAAGW
jgi:hypothetical protein